MTANAKYRNVRGSIISQARVVRGRRIEVHRKKTKLIRAAGMKNLLGEFMETRMFISAKSSELQTRK